MSTENIKFSVILSIYNVEAYLNRCIESIVNQSYKNLEIILVDDGSPDKCPQICEDWAKKDCRIKVLHKKNAGLGEARNSGLKIATGDYVAFYDSDDYVSLDIFSDTIEVIKNCYPDMITYGSYILDTNLNIKRTKIPQTGNNYYEGTSILSDFVPKFMCVDPVTGKHYGMTMSAWGNIYKKAILDSCGFKFVSEREIIAEDIYSLMWLMPKLNSVYVMNKAYYYYCENGASLTRTYREDRFDKILYYQEKMMQLCSDPVYGEEINLRIYRPFLDYLMACLKMEANSTGSIGWKKVHSNIKNICENGIVRSGIDSLNSSSFSMGRRILYFCMKHNLVLPAIMLLKAKEQ